MNEIINETIKTELSKEIRKYLMYCEDLKRFNNVYQNYKNLSEDKIIDFMKSLDVQKHDNVKLVKHKYLRDVSVKEIRQAFNDKSMADLVVVKVDVEKTIENIKLKNGHSEKIAKGLLELLLELYELEVEKIEVLK